MFKFKSKVRNLGNSNGVIIPKIILEYFNIQRGDELSVTVVDEVGRKGIFIEKKE